SIPINDTSPSPFCGGNDDSGAGLITAPEDNVPYRCIWHLKAKDNGTLKATVQVASFLSTETTPGTYNTCLANYISLYDGETVDAPLSGPYSNDPYLDYKTTGSALTLEIVQADVQCSFFALVLYESGTSHKKNARKELHESCIHMCEFYLYGSHG
ncbi:CUB domain protein, partial [Opisthorchis viverrini]